MGFQFPRRRIQSFVLLCCTAIVGTVFMTMVTQSWQSNLAQRVSRDAPQAQEDVRLQHNIVKRDATFLCPNVENRTLLEVPAVPKESKELLPWVMRQNEELTVLNEDVFGRLREVPVRHIIVIQAHNRSEYLRWLLHSLSRVRGIDSALLVLSHDVVDDAMLALGSEVCFCRVVRVYFPHSMQINMIEGCGKRFCHRKRGITMAKHHWWWLHNLVFTDIFDLANLSAPQDDRSPIALFLEEDMYVSPDALYMLDMLQDARPDVNMMSLSNSTGEFNATSANEVLLSHWMYNMGLAMGLSAWSKIVRCAKYFCTTNEFNWDITMQGVGAFCVPGQFLTLVLAGSRVFHIGQCGGMHYTSTLGCDSLLATAQRVLDESEEAGLLFPTQLVLREKLDVVAGKYAYGGWADVRDHKLCMDNAAASLRRWGQ